jgi:hypothetical protein
MYNKYDSLDERKLGQTELNPLLHYVYPCQRFSSGNTLEDYNP